MDEILLPLLEASGALLLADPFIDANEDCPKRFRAFSCVSCYWEGDDLIIEASDARLLSGATILIKTLPDGLVAEVEIFRG